MYANKLGILAGLWEHMAGTQRNKLSYPEELINLRNKEKKKPTASNLYLILA